MPYKNDYSVLIARKDEKDISEMLLGVSERKKEGNIEVFNACFSEMEKLSISNIFICTRLLL